MNFLSDVNVQFVFFGCLIFGASSGVLGSFAFLRKRSLVGDAIAHAALPGICIAFLIAQTKHPLVIILGAAASALLGSFAIEVISKRSRIKEDTAIALVLSVFFGVGIVLLTYIQHQPFGNQSGLDKFLFGQAASLVGRDVQIFGGLAAVLLVAVSLAYKEFKVIVFDPSYAETIGIPTRWIEALLTLLIVLVVTTGLQAVGVVLMAAMLITPAAAARQWTDRLSHMIFLAGLFGAIAGASGAFASTLAPRMPTGPWIVVVVTALFAISILAAPRRGMIARWLRHIQVSQKINFENVLLTLYRLYEQKPHEPTSINLIRRYRALTVRATLKLLSRLERQKCVTATEHPDHWKLTAQGLDRARHLIRRHRLWEVYLSRYLHLGSAHLHADAEEIEHILTPELEAELEKLLGAPTQDPHQKPIPEGGAR